MKNEYVIIVAGGTGSRMNSDVPKQFLKLNSVPVIIKTMRCFLKYDATIQFIVCVHKDYKSHLEELLVLFDFKNVVQIVIGGETRFDSVKSGLAFLKDENSVVGIHDAARPFVSVETIKNCFITAQQKGNAVPCISLNESLRKIYGDQNNAVKREDYKIIQTPQCFLTSAIKKAFQQDFRQGFTDDATVFESIGETINLVEGNAGNIKITTRYDLQIATFFSKNE